MFKYMKAYEEENDLLISGLQHFEFCRRQWALIHIEQEWEENILTLEGQEVHEKVDQPFIKENRKETRIVRALPVRSSLLGISGVCDVVEFNRDPLGVELSVIGDGKKYLPYPVEYKRGKPKKHAADILQLTAQAMCLEEMLGCEINDGALYYHEVRRRERIHFTPELREQVVAMTKEMHHYFKRQYTPRVKTGKHCERCSLRHICLPELLDKETPAAYIKRMMAL